jgi:hypothetical protein
MRTTRVLLVLLCCVALVGVGCRARTGARSLFDGGAPTTSGARATTATAPSMELAWTYPGKWFGLAADPSDKSLYANGFDGIAHLGADGKLISSVSVASAPGVPQGMPSMETLLRVGNLDGDPATEFVVFGSWGHAVTALDDDGRQLWSYVAQNEPGTDDVWLADLDADGRCEVVIGYNGDGGLRVVGPDGRQRWADTSIGNCWHVTAADTTGDGKPEALSTSASGVVSGFAADGRQLGETRVAVYADMVRPAPQVCTGTKLVVAGSARSLTSGGGCVVGIAQGGKTLWETPIEVEHSEEGISAPAKPWFALAAGGMRGRSQVLVLNADDGAVLAIAETAAESLAWLIPGDGADPLLCVSADDGIRAYRVKP